MLKLILPTFIGLLLLGSAPIASAHPHGNYTESCKHCRMNGGTLSCKCQNANQEYAGKSYLAFANACNNIENIDGLLTCTGGYDYGYHPHKNNHHHNNKHKKWTNIDAGPIFSNDEAQTTCPQVCGGAKCWNGQWTTLGTTSVCQCKQRRR